MARCCPVVNTVPSNSVPSKTHANACPSIAAVLQAPSGPIKGYNMLHYLNEYLTKESGPKTKDGKSLGGDPLTGEGSWASELSQVLKETVKV